jgi:gliding motility-associated-like protein
MAGTYVVESISDANCINNNLTEVQTIIINPVPNPPIAGTDTVYCENAIPLTMNAQGNGLFTWYSDQSLMNVIGSGSTLLPSMNIGTSYYYVTETINGCISSPTELTIIVEECGVIIPTAFTPDNDQSNDTWILQDIDLIYPNNRVSIYNRWGNLLYQTPEGSYESNPWNGTFNDEELPVGSYYFIIEFNDGFTTSKSGIVSILK